MASVQFRGVDKVLGAFDAMKVPRWSLWQSTTLLWKHCGDDLEESKQTLEQWLDMMDSSTNAIYTLRFYSKSVSEITNKTPYDAGFNFRLNLDSQEINGGQYRQLSSQTAILSELAALREEVKELRDAEDDEDDETENDAFGKILNGIAESPMIPQLIGKLFGMDPSKVSLAGVPDQELTDIIEGLKKHDPDLKNHLHKLLLIAEQQPATFKMMLGMLDK